MVKRRLSTWWATKGEQCTASRSLAPLPNVHDCLALNHATETNNTAPPRTKLSSFPSRGGGDLFFPVPWWCTRLGGAAVLQCRVTASRQPPKSRCPRVVHSPPKPRCNNANLVCICLGLLLPSAQPSCLPHGGGRPAAVAHPVNCQGSFDRNCVTAHHRS